MKKVSAIPAADYQGLRDPWLDGLFDGEIRQLDPADWESRYATARSAASAIHQAARKRGFSAKVAIRGDVLYVQAILNGKVAKPATKTSKAPAKRTAKKAVA